jgi:hypothetical protein
MRGSHFEPAFAGIVERRDLADVASRHAGILEAVPLPDGLRLLDPGADLISAGLPRNSLKGSAGSSTWMSIRSSNGPLILPRYDWICQGVRRHSLPAVSVYAAVARIHRGHQHEARRKAQRHGGARDGGLPVLQRLAEHFLNVVRIAEFVRELHGVVRRLTSPRGACRRHRRSVRIGNRVVRRPEGTIVHDAVARPTGDVAMLYTLLVSIASSGQ